MLPLRRTFKNFSFVILSSFLFISCSNHSKQDAEIIKALNESIESSNKWLEVSTNDIMLSLRAKIEEQGSVERAKIWYPKAEQIQLISKDIYDYIENIKQKVKDTSINSLELFDKLNKYQKQILEVDLKIKNQFQRSIKLFTQSIDSSKNNQQELFREYFKKRYSESTVAMLSKLQNNIKGNELKITTFCNEQVGRMSDWYTVMYYPWSSQSSTIVMSGERIEISAGLTSYVNNKPPNVYINNKLIQLNEYGAAVYRFKVPSNPGKYYVPVKIKYIDQNGKEQIVQKNMEYTVANFQKQE